MKRLLAVVVLSVFAVGCGEDAPTAPTNINIDIENNNTNNNGIPLPNATPVPSPGAPGAVDKVIVAGKITEIGGDGQKTVKVGDEFFLTYTPLNKDGKDPCVGFNSLAECGAYTESDVEWLGGTGVTTDTSGVVQALGTGETRYNYKFRALKTGAFIVRARFRSGAIPDAEFGGNVVP